MPPTKIPNSLFLGENTDNRGGVLARAVSTRSIAGGPTTVTDPRKILMLDGNPQRGLLAQAIREVGREMGDEFWTEVDYFENAVRDLHQNLQIIDRALLQKTVVTRYASDFVQEFYQSVLVDYTDRITRDCIVNNSSSLQCASTTFINVGLGALNAFDPITYMKAACNALIRQLEESGAISKEKADEERALVEVIFFASDLVKAAKLLADLRAAVKDLPNAKVAKSGDLKRSSAPVKRIKKVTDEGTDVGIDEATEAIDKDQESRDRE